jgi:uncharacterized protein (DUF433 family)
MQIGCSFVAAACRRDGSSDRTSRRLDQESVVGQLDRITQNPEIMGGKACIRGMRVTVGMIVGQIGAGRAIDDVLSDFPYLEREDILQALRYAAWRAEEREVVLASG